MFTGAFAQSRIGEHANAPCGSSKCTRQVERSDY